MRLTKGLCKGNLKSVCYPIISKGILQKLSPDQHYYLPSQYCLTGEGYMRWDAQYNQMNISIFVYDRIILGQICQHSNDFRSIYGRIQLLTSSNLDNRRIFQAGSNKGVLRQCHTDEISFLFIDTWFKKNFSNGLHRWMNSVSRRFNLLSDIIKQRNLVV